MAPYVSDPQLRTLNAAITLIVVIDANHHSDMARELASCCLQPYIFCRERRVALGS